MDNGSSSLSLDSISKSVYSAISDYRMEQALKNPDFDECAKQFYTKWAQSMSSKQSEVHFKDNGNSSKLISEGCKVSSRKASDCQEEDFALRRLRRASIVARAKIRKALKFLNVKRKDDSLKRRRRPGRYIDERYLEFVMARHKIAKNDRKWELQEKIWFEEERRKLKEIGSKNLDKALIDSSHSTQNSLD